MNLFKKYKTFEEILPDFLLIKEMQVNVRSAAAYYAHTGIFKDWLKRNGYDKLPIRKLTPEIINSFFIFLGKVRKLDKPTCQKYFFHLRLVFNYAKKHGELESLPFGNIEYPKKRPSKSAEVIRPEHLKPLLEEIKRVDPQLYLACNFEYYCFIRPGKELRLLRIGDVDLENGTITVRQENAKNSIKQSVTMPRQLIEICREYGVDKADKKLYIFGKRKRFGTVVMSDNMLRWRFNKYRDELNLPKGYKFYSFKHTGASMLHRSGISMRELMDQLRHTKLDATQHYLKKHCGIVNDRIRDNFPSPI